MQNLFLFSFLEGNQNLLPRLLVHDDASSFGPCESLGPNLTPVDERKSQAVSNDRTQFFNQIQCEAGTTWAITMKKADRRIEADGLECGCDVMGQERVEE